MKNNRSSYICRRKVTNCLPNPLTNTFSDQSSLTRQGPAYLDVVGVDLLARQDIEGAVVAPAQEDAAATVMPALLG